MGKPRKAIPERWVPAFKRAGITSYAELAEKSGVKRTTITNFIDGVGGSSAETVEAVAQVLKTTPARVREIRGDGRRTPFVVPTDADLMTRHQMDVVRSLIVEFVNTEKKIARLSETADDALDGLRGQTGGDAAHEGGENQ